MGSQHIVEKYKEFGMKCPICNGVLLKRKEVISDTGVHTVTPYLECIECEEIYYIITDE